MKQEVDVVFSSADGQHIYVVVFGDSSQVSSEAGLQFAFYDFAAGLSAEDYVDVIFRKCVGQCAAPSAWHHGQEPMLPG